VTVEVFWRSLQNVRVNAAVVLVLSIIIKFIHGFC
jgi:hypothetical protein